MDGGLRVARHTELQSCEQRLGTTANVRLLDLRKGSLPSLSVVPSLAPTFFRWASNRLGSPKLPPSFSSRGEGRWRHGKFLGLQFHRVAALPPGAHFISGQTGILYGPGKGAARQPKEMSLTMQHEVLWERKVPLCAPHRTPPPPTV